MKNIKKLLKNFILKLPLGNFFICKYNNNIKKIQNKKYHKKLFTRYYETNYWGSSESLSGPGSTLKATEVLRNELADFLKIKNVRTWLDAPCGDYNWVKYVKRPEGLKYIGGDIVDEIISLNKKLFSDNYTTFKLLDITSSKKMPQSDIWLCRDCFIHLSYEQIFKTILSFINSDIHFWLVSTDLSCELNSDIEIGGARALNLQIAPFYFPLPEIYLKDGVTRMIGVWSKESILMSLENNQAWQHFLISNK